MIEICYSLNRKENCMDEIEQVYKEYSKMVYGFLLSKANNPHVAEELTQETFYQAIKNIDKYQGRSEISTWLCGIANNVWKTYVKKNKKSIPIEDKENEIFINGMEDTVFQKLDVLHLMKILHQVKEPMKEVVYLRLIGNLSFKDIGEVMGKSENWARVNFYRGKEKIIKEAKCYEK